MIIRMKMALIIKMKSKSETRNKIPRNHEIYQKYKSENKSKIKIRNQFKF